MKIITIGGGTGTYNMLLGFKEIPNIQISAIVSMSDDGGSTGKLRDEYGVLPGGDIRRAILALANFEKSHILRNLFNYRFKGGGLDNHNLGNLMMMALTDIAGSYGKAVNILEDIFGVQGKVYPVTFDKTRLLAKIENGKYILGETNIDIPKHDGNLKIINLSVIKEEYIKFINKIDDDDIGLKAILKDNFLNQIIEDKPQANPKLEKIISQADYIIFGPGDLHTSILPNILVGNIKNRILNSQAQKILITNLFTKFGETTGYKISNFISEFNKYFGKDIFHKIIIQDREKFPIKPELLIKYQEEKKEIVNLDISDPRIILTDFMKQADFARHDSEKIKNFFISFFEKK